MSPKANGGDSALGFEADLFKAADKLRGNMEPSDYKHVALGLIFLKHISDSFEAKHAQLLSEDKLAAEDPDEYKAENIFWVPKEARWSHLRANAKQPTIGKLVDDAMLAIEKLNPSLKGVLPKEYARPALNAVMLGELIDLISGIALGKDQDNARDLLGRVYEYFLAGFAGSEGKRGGEFYTPRSVVRVMVEMLEPYKGRVYDPCCGSGGMFVQSEKFVEAHGGKIGDIAIYGQESNYTTWRLAKMNLAVRGIDADIKWNSDGTFHKDEFKDLRFDYILANPPFNDSDWGGERLEADWRWKFGSPPASNANFAWVQHMLAHLSTKGSAAFVLAIMSLSSDNEAETQIRRTIVDNDLVEAIVTLPDKLFYSTPIAACIWILAKDKSKANLRKRAGKVLFIDASKDFTPESRTRNAMSDDAVSRISTTFKRWRDPAAKFSSEPGFSQEVDISAIKANRYSLFPAAYIAEHRVAGPKIDGPTGAQILQELSTRFDASVQRRDQIKTLLRAASEMRPHFFSGAVESFKMSDVLELSEDRLGKLPEPEILTCTEGAGLVLQRERFSKRVATEDTSAYKIVRYTDIVYNPYLLWNSAIDQCTVVELGITSPAYAVFRIKEGFDPFVVGRALKSASMVHKYGGISVGTVKRRRRAAPERFLELEISLPPRDEQAEFRSISKLLFEEAASGREISRLVDSRLSDLVRSFA